jgi:hypothetical protein
MSLGFMHRCATACGVGESAIVLLALVVAAKDRAFKRVQIWGERTCLEGFSCHNAAPKPKFFGQTRKLARACGGILGLELHRLTAADFARVGLTV